ncbi:MAG TPA: class I SAM-dependent methyltransferase [Nitratidesulfovibrio sp.]|nr:class I SAM-dependent methyltransferase [Nitratidesulfovibrio sp.]
MQRYLDAETRQLVYCKNMATSAFWDGHWKETDLRMAHDSPRNRVVQTITRRYLVPGSTVLEGGCGPATTVAILDKAGHRAVGLDFAVDTLREVHAVAPQLRLAAGNVFHLPFPDASFDGYWSIGVIEHFHAGYVDIVKEAARVIRPGGYLFLTFPWMSPLRKMKAKRALYPSLPESFDPIRDQFYQFALSGEAVCDIIESMGFLVCLRKGIDALKGIKDECGNSRRLSSLYAAKGMSARIMRLALNNTLGNLAGHSLLVVAQRTQY